MSNAQRNCASNGFFRLEKALRNQKWEQNEKSGQIDHPDGLVVNTEQFPAQFVNLSTVLCVTAPWPKAEMVSVNVVTRNGLSKIMWGRQFWYDSVIEIESVSGKRSGIGANEVSVAIHGSSFVVSFWWNLDLEILCNIQNYFGKTNRERHTHSVWCVTRFMNESLQSNKFLKFWPTMNSKNQVHCLISN